MQLKNLVTIISRTYQLLTRSAKLHRHSNPVPSLTASFWSDGNQWMFPRVVKKQSYTSSSSARLRPSCGRTFIKHADDFQAKVRFPKK